MSALLLLARAGAAPENVLPALSVLPHSVRSLAAEPAALLTAPPHEAVLLDATSDLSAARGLCRLLRTTGLEAPLEIDTYLYPRCFRKAILRTGRFTMGFRDSAVVRLLPPRSVAPPDARS